jgi:hypothetical protein
VKDLFQFVQHFLGARLSNLLTGLLFEVRFSVVKDTLEDGILDSNKRLKKTIDEIQKAKKRHISL